MHFPYHSLAPLTWCILRRRLKWTKIVIKYSYTYSMFWQNGDDNVDENKIQSHRNVSHFSLIVSGIQVRESSLDRICRFVVYLVGLHRTKTCSRWKLKRFVIFHSVWLVFLFIAKKKKKCMKKSVYLRRAIQSTLERYRVPVHRYPFFIKVLRCFGSFQWKFVACIDTVTLFRI